VRHERGTHSWRSASVCGGCVDFGAGRAGELTESKRLSVGVALGRAIMAIPHWDVCVFTAGPIKKLCAGGRGGQ
jgi:hypothetical protein